MIVDEMVEWHHQCYGHEFEEAPGVGDGQGSLVCCSPINQGNGNLLQYFNLENPLDRGARWITVYWVTKSWT